MTGWGRYATRWALLSAALATLAACAALPALPALPRVASRCATVDEQALKYINWAQVPEITIRIRNGEFSPMIVRLRQGWPYVLRIRNRDHQTRVLRSVEFFERVAVIKSTVAGVDDSETCFGGLRVPGRQTAEIRLVAVTDGYYEYADTWLPVPGLLSTAPNGVIIVEERKPRI